MNFNRPTQLPFQDSRSSLPFCISQQHQNHKETVTYAGQQDKGRLAEL